MHCSHYLESLIIFSLNFSLNFVSEVQWGNENALGVETHVHLPPAACQRWVLTAHCHALLHPRSCLAYHALPPLHDCCHSLSLEKAWARY